MVVPSQPRRIPVLQCHPDSVKIICFPDATSRNGQERYKRGRSTCRKFRDRSNVGVSIIGELQCNAGFQKRDFSKIPVDRVFMCKVYNYIQTARLCYAWSESGDSCSWYSELRTRTRRTPKFWALVSKFRNPVWNPVSGFPLEGHCHIVYYMFTNAYVCTCLLCFLAGVTVSLCPNYGWILPHSLVLGQ